MSCFQSGFNHQTTILFAAYRFYDRQTLATKRALVRKPVHDPMETMLADNPNIQYWTDLYTQALAGEVLPRHTVPWYLPKSAVQRFHDRCSLAVKTSRDLQILAELAQHTVRCYTTDRVPIRTATLKSKKVHKKLVPWTNKKKAFFLSKFYVV